MNDDRLSPEPLSRYAETTVSNATPNTQAARQNSADVTGPFTKIDLERQKRERETPKLQHTLTPNGPGYTQVQTRQFEFTERQIKYREQVLDSLQDRAKEAFNMAEGKQARKLER